MTTATELAEQAAEAIRALNHQTIDIGISAPDAASIIGDLVLVAERLPQLLGQLGHRLAAEAEAGRIRLDADGGERWATPAEAVAAAGASLDGAAVAASDLARALKDANESTSTMGRPIADSYDDEE